MTLLFSLNPANPESSTALWIIFLLGMFALGFLIAWFILKDKASGSSEDTDMDGSDVDVAALIHDRDEAIQAATVYAAQLESCQTDLNTKVMEMSAENNDLKLALESCRKGLLEEGVEVTTPRPKVVDLPPVQTATALDPTQIHSLEEVKAKRDRLETQLIAANGALSVIGNSFGVVFDPNKPNDLLDKVKELGGQHKELTAKILKLEREKENITRDLATCKTNLKNVIGASEFTEMPFGTEDGGGGKKSS